ncbi:hypothetical protein Nepgr_025135 [Nepenthes gracilis]|uniref:ENTH domain-containing protein n=1 Tax=Nepenthes gracilis TaxID=150966 RepID=A0AAD3XZ93_NEPGR|nr:hypothetical protein Nepgr_025135 [Nepenthes gracilis]
MKQWRRASGVLKDTNSLWTAALLRRSKYIHPDLETAVIKATSHDERVVDHKSTQLVFAWIRTSVVHLLPFMRTLSRRMKRTCSSIVAMKGLILLHGVLCTKIPAVRKIGRLPFDLSDFSDGYSDPSKRWSFNAFVRAYFAFLDQKSVLLSRDFHDETVKLKEDFDDHRKIKLEEEPIAQKLAELQILQTMLDRLLDVRPRGRGMNEVVVLEVMDCVIIEVFDVYSKICDGIADVLIRIYGAAGTVEAAIALEVLQRATRQGDELANYFEICREIGLLNASQCPKLERIPRDDIRELQRIINGVSAGKSTHCSDAVEEDKAIFVVGEQRIVEGEEAHKPLPSLTTTTTHKWEVFDDDLKVGDLIDLSDEAENTTILSLSYHHQLQI